MRFLPSFLHPAPSSVLSLSATCKKKMREKNQATNTSSTTTKLWPTDMAFRNDILRYSQTHFSNVTDLHGTAFADGIVVGDFDLSDPDVISS